jgi:hypothetical protein
LRGFGYNEDGRNLVDWKFYRTFVVMKGYLLKNSDCIATKKMVVKYGKTKISDPSIEGDIVIKNIRLYNYGQSEIDIEFTGKIKARYAGKNDWLSSSIMNQRVSKVKVNRIIRNGLYKTLKQRLNYFGVNLYHYSDIKKLKWI